MKQLIAAAAFAMLLVSSNFVRADAPPGDKKKPGGKDPETIFNKLDTNKDGQLSPDEFARLGELRKRAGDAGKAGAKAEGRLSKLFSRLDTNHDGVLSLDEFKRIREIRRNKGGKS